MGDNRMTRWLTCVCDEDIVDQELCNRLIVFLEKDMKIEQQKLLVYRKSELERQKDRKPPTKGNVHYTGDRYTDNCAFW